jgi:hypothetical protein
MLWFLFLRVKVLIFNEHGSYQVTFDGHIILINATGPWNEETALSYAEEIKTLQRKVSGACLGIVFVVQGESIGTPDAKEALQELQQWRVKEGYVWPTAMVFLDTDRRFLYEAIFRDLYKLSPMPPRFFPAIDQAKKWLMEVVTNS